MKKILKTLKADKIDPVYGYLIVHFATSTLGHMFALFQYYSPTYQVLWLMLTSMFPILYSSTYYIDYFSSMYNQNVEEKANSYRLSRGEELASSAKSVAADLQPNQKQNNVWL